MTINIIKPPNPPPFLAYLTLDVPGNQIINQNLTTYLDIIIYHKPKVGLCS